jgi:hypothetical protein
LINSNKTLKFYYLEIKTKYAYNKLQQATTSYNKLQQANLQWIKFFVMKRIIFCVSEIKEMREIVLFWFFKIIFTFGSKSKTKEFKGFHPLKNP